MDLLKHLIISRVRIKLLKLFFNFPDKIFHVREIVRQCDEEINAVRRELKHLEKCSLLSHERRANRVYYGLRKDYVLFFDILELVNKTSGLSESILKNRSKLGKIKFALVSGKFVRRRTRSEKNEVDALIVGNIVLPELAYLVKQEEMRLSREINYTVMSEEEFSFRKNRRDPFVLGILQGTKTMIIGDEEELIS